MAERRTARSGTGGRTSTRRRPPADRDDMEILDEQEILDEEPEVRDEDELLDADEPEGARSTRSAMTAAEAARAALRQIAELTAKQPEGIVGVEHTKDGWTVGVELVEDQRIPSSADILATYEITIGPDGEMLSYQRIRRYARGRGDTEEL
jgi:hypothetical protein